MFQFDLIRYAMEGSYEFGAVLYEECPANPNVLIATPSAYLAARLSEAQVLELRRRYEAK